MSNERPAIICAVGKPHPDDIEGSVAAACTECGQDISIAPSGQRIIADTDATPLCTPCGMEAIANDPAARVMPPSAEQLQELAHSLAPDLWA